MKHTADYLASCAVTCSPASLDSYTQRILRFETYRRTHPGKITRMYHNRYFIHLASEGLQRLSILSHRATLHAFWEWCCDMGLAFENPVGRAVTPAPALDKERAIYTEDEYRTLLAKAKELNHPYWGEAIQLAWHTGLRLGDIAMLHWHQIDLQAKVIRVTPSKTIRFGKKLELPIADELEACLMELSLRTGADKYVNRGMAVHYLFDRHKSLGGQFKRLCQKAGVKFGSFHGFRRSFVSRMVNAGISPAVICSLTGHSLPQVMTYVKVSLETKREAIQTADQRQQIA